MISRLNDRKNHGSMAQVYRVIFALISTCLVSGVQSQQPGSNPAGGSAEEGKLEVTQSGFEDRLRVAIAELDISSGRDNQLEVAYMKTVTYDLEFSDYFIPLRPTPQMAEQHRADSQIRAIDYGAWQKLGAQVLLKAEFEDYGTQGKIRFFAHDVFSKASLAALQYDIVYDSKERKIREVRRSVHNFVDKLVNNYDPLPGCASSYIAFENVRRIADRTGNAKTVREIFIMDYDGRNVRQITQDRNLAVSPAWSPDGRKLVYTSYRQGPPDLYLYDLDTGRIKVLAAFPGLNSAAAWHPSGQSLVASLSRDGNPEIYRISAAGSNPVRLTRSRAVETSPTWSPKGEAIYFISDRAGAPQVMGMDANGGRTWSLTSAGQNDDPHVSPRGDRIVFTSNRDRRGFDIWIMDVNGGNAANLTRDLRGNCEHPSWAPDGRHIAFGHDGKIVVMDADGSDKRVLTSPDRLSGSNYSPAWGP